ncbi:competence protein ComEA [Luteipulveratus mongoliensis]|uniref:Competence protein ComEA n=2 Tax=Luteipulveratus mongoliensis TaxID=571913 RepID=A0A0K1JQQ6_9MICO|nr:competence protein ComEA [Luteipulveratus mongoliensis]
MVHVVGQVRRPGVVRLPAGARVQDAVTAAGGATAKADLARVNLARPVVDGEQVIVPRPGEQVAPPASVPGAASTGSAGGPVAGAGSSAPGGPVNLNTADEAGLDGLPGVGPVIAQRIVQWRTENGRFTSVEELSEVSGIGDKLMEQLRPLVSV